MAPLDALCLDEPPRDAALEQLHDGRCNSLTLAPGSADDAELFAAIDACPEMHKELERLRANPTYNETITDMLRMIHDSAE